MELHHLVNRQRIDWHCIPSTGFAVNSELITASSVASTAASNNGDICSFGRSTMPSALRGAPSSGARPHSSRMQPLAALSVAVILAFTAALARRGQSAQTHPIFGEEPCRGSF